MQTLSNKGEGRSSLVQSVSCVLWLFFDKQIHWHIRGKFFPCCTRSTQTEHFFRVSTTPFFLSLYLLAHTYTLCVFFGNLAHPWNLFDRISVCCGRSYVYIFLSCMCSVKRKTSFQACQVEGRGLENKWNQPAKNRYGKRRRSIIVIRCGGGICEVFSLILKRICLCEKLLWKKFQVYREFLYFFFLYFSLNPFDVERIYFLYWIRVYRYV